jgi:hypothetical protein
LASQTADLLDYGAAAFVIIPSIGVADVRLEDPEQNHDASRLAQLALFYDALVQLYLTLDSIPKLPILGRQRRPDLVHPECGVARRQVWSEVNGLTDIEFAS